MVDIARLRFAVETKDLKKAQTELDKLTGAGKRTEKSTKKLKSSFDGLKVAALGFASALSVKEFISYADEMTNLSSRIGLVTNSTEQLNAVQAELFNMSQVAGVGLKDTSDLYTQIARSVKGTTFTHKDLLEITGTLSKALTVSGASAASANAALTQLSQGLASGTLRGEELNSIMEQTPRLSQAIADGMGITIGQLRAMGAEGKLTTKVVLDAIHSQGSAINDEFSQMTITVSQAMTQVNNSIMVAVGGINEATGATEGLATTVSDVATFISKHTNDIAQGFLGIKFVFNVIDVSFWTLVTQIDKYMESIGNGWNTMTAGMHNAFKSTVDFIGESFYGVINYILRLINDATNNISTALGGALEFAGIDNPFQKVNLSIGKYTSSLKEAKAETFTLMGTDYAKSKLKSSVEDMNKTYTTLINGVKVAKKVNDELLNTKVRGAYTPSKSIVDNSKTLKENIKLAEKQLALRKEYYQLIGKNEKVFSIDANKKLTDMMKSGVFSQDEMSKAYDAMWEDFKNSGKEASQSVSDMLQDAFNIKNDSVFANFLDALQGSLESFISAFKSGDSMNVANATGDLIINSLPPGYKEAAMIISALGSSYLSEDEIKQASGRSSDDINSKGTAQIISTLESANAKEYAVSNSMLQHLKSMDENLIGALNNVQGLDLAGGTYTPEASSIAGGVIFASSTELIGAGVKFYDQAVSSFTQGVEADGYEAIKKTSTTLGIFTSESISESIKELPDKTTKQIGEAFNDGLQSALEGLYVLGFDATAIEKQLQDYVISIGKIDFKDLSIEEQAQALNRALTEQLNGAISGAMDNLADPYFYEALQDMATAGEEITSTIARVAVGFETVGASLSALGTEVSTFTQSNALIEATGSLSAWKSAQDQFIGMLSDGEQKQYMENMLTQALAVYDIALPASKAQFIALKKETEAKILSTQAEIDTMKASIRADIAANKYKIKADGNYARSAISTAENINKAAILTGKSANDMIKAAKGAEVSATKIDYTKAYEDDVGLQALEAELGNLQGIYGTLMSNMGTFASFYSEQAEIISEAQKKLLDLQNGSRSLAYEWIGLSELSVAEFELKRLSESTGLGSLTGDNFYAEFTKALVAGIDDEDLEKWKQQSDAIQRVTKAREEENKALEDFKTSANNAFKDLFEDSIAELRGGLDAYILASDYSGAMSSYNSLLDDAKQRNNNKIDYFLESARLNQKIQDLQPVNPNKGMEERLDKLNDAIERLELIEKDTSTACNATATSCNTTAVACKQTADNTAVIASESRRYTIAPQSTTASYENGINYTGSAL